MSASVDARTASNIGRFLAALDTATAETGISLAPNGAPIEGPNGDIISWLERQVVDGRYCTYQYRGESP